MRIVDTPGKIFAVEIHLACICRCPCQGTAASYSSSQLLRHAHINLPTSVLSLNSTPMSLKIPSRRRVHHCFFQLKLRDTKRQQPADLWIPIENPTGLTPARGSAHRRSPRPAGPAPMIATRLPVQCQHRDRSGRPSHRQCSVRNVFLGRITDRHRAEAVIERASPFAKGRS